MVDHNFIISLRESPLKLSVKAYLQLIRIHNTIGSALSAFMGFAVASKWDFEPVPLILSMLTVSLIAAGGYVINDYYDVEIDRINKPYRPIPSGAVSLRTARNLALALMVLGIASSMFINVWAILIAVITAVALWEYARWIKRTGLPGNLIVALFSALSAFYGGLAYFKGDWLFLVSIPTVYIFFFTLAREFVKGIEDYEGDKAHGVATLAVTLGVKRTWIIAKIVVLGLLLTSLMPYFLWGFNVAYLVIEGPMDAILVLSLLQPNDIKSAAKVRGWMKVFAIGTMLAFVLGSSPLIKV